jgi:hypothetical protein
MLLLIIGVLVIIISSISSGISSIEPVFDVVLVQIDAHFSISSSTTSIKVSQSSYSIKSGITGIVTVGIDCTSSLRMNSFIVSGELTRFLFTATFHFFTTISELLSFFCTPNTVPLTAAVESVVYISNHDSSSKSAALFHIIHDSRTNLISVIRLFSSGYSNFSRVNIDSLEVSHKIERDQSE